VLLSGRGSNFVALADACARGEVPAEIALVVSNRDDAPGLERAREREIAALAIPGKGVPREEHEAKVVAALDGAGAQWICLAGYMRLLSEAFVARFPHRILNIHPALLPAFPGLHAQRQALEHGVKLAGASVHIVTDELDAGPILAQEAVPVLEGDDEERLAARILEAEHRIYPRAVRAMLEGRVRLAGRRAIVEGA
jgi:phosphoribosylglycinamide formyltransferase-1